MSAHSDSETRRQFLEASAALAAGLPLVNVEAAARDRAAVPRVRRNFGRLDPSVPADKQVIDQYTQGVTILKQRSETAPSDPRGWRAQARLHTNRCQHGNWWFLPWHRAYIYFFERMIQDAVGDPTFALPYWDWTDPTQLSLPAAFRDAASKLHDENRRQSVNNPTNPARLNWSFYDQNHDGVKNYVLTRRNFVPSLGSPRADSFPGLERNHGPEYPHGDFEGGPHDTVHLWVTGGEFADMGVPATAAFDPIFWLHHANIDRLWTLWRLHDPQTHRNPSRATWRDQRFEFLGTGGGTASITVAELVETQSEPLNYRYDDEPANPTPRVVVPAPVPGVERPMAAHLPDKSPPLAVAELRFEIGATPLTVTLNVPARQRPALRATAEAGNRAGAPALLLTVEDIQFEDRAAGVVEVYLNAPAAGADKPIDRVHAVGTFTVFADHEPHGGPDQPAPRHPEREPMPARASRVFDVTDVVRGLMAAGDKWKDGELRVTFLRRPFDAGERAAAGKVTFARVAIRASAAE